MINQYIWNILRIGYLNPMVPHLSSEDLNARCKWHDFCQGLINELLQHHYHWGCKKPLINRRWKSEDIQRLLSCSPATILKMWRHRQRGPLRYWRLKWTQLAPHARKSAQHTCEGNTKTPHGSPISCPSGAKLFSACANLTSGCTRLFFRLSLAWHGGMMWHGMLASGNQRLQWEMFSKPIVK